MIKRQESASSSSSIDNPTSLSAVASTMIDDDYNGKDKKHGSISDALHRYMVRNGKVIVICITALILSVFLIPPLKVIISSSPSFAQHLFPISSQYNMDMDQQPSTHTTQQTTLQDQIPPCSHSPWKTNEDLRGKCPGDLKPFKDATTISECASTCCSNPTCISWQYRSDVGCLQGGDVRLGQEKDGVSAWCSDHPPQKWNGAYLKVHKDRHQGMDEDLIRKRGCNLETWDPNEEIGQCFGLGDVKTKDNASDSAEDCMKVCCKDSKCGAWQWNKNLGCFYSKGMHGCQGHGDPIAFEPFIGRRKHQDSRTYTDKHNKPWQMTM